jgi:hypothetical protein
MVRRSVFSIVAMMCLASFLMGCGTFRGLPSHGGGKRFDEEQRVVSGAIRQALADMDLEELRGRRVKITVNSMAHSASAEAYWPGLQNIRVTAFDNNTLYNNARTAFENPGWLPGLSPWLPQYTDHNRTDAEGANANVTINRYPRLDPNITRSDEDTKYLMGALEMSALHWGVVSDLKKPEATLCVLVDVMGTNLSMRDGILFNKQNLRASCELTYYAVDVRTGQLIFPARRVSAVSDYGELGVLGVSGLRIDRSLERNTPTPFPELAVPANVEAAKLLNGESENGTHANGTAAPDAANGAEKPGNGADDEEAKRLQALFNRAKEFLGKQDYDGAQRIVNRIKALDSNYPGLRKIQDTIDEEGDL